MTDLFDDEDDLSETVGFVSADEEVDVELLGNSTLDARRKLENMLEERRLREELEDDFTDY